MTDVVGRGARMAPWQERLHEIASLPMVLGYALIIVPTGSLSAELAQRAAQKPVSTRACPACSREGHDPDARPGKGCGAAL